MTLATFSAFFWILAGIILLMFIFEEKLLALEEKWDARKENKKVVTEDEESDFSMC